VACPPVKHPCFYGVDFPTYEELLANQKKTLEEIRNFLEVDSIGYVSLEGLLGCASLPADHYCAACWNGKYRIPVSTIVNKFSNERHQMQLFDDVEL
jgi:amidophosphoribosyltransferase